MVLILAAYGIVFAAIYRITSNIFIMWPLTWSTASAMGTLKGGFLFGWSDVALVSVVLAIQVGFMVYAWRKKGG